MPDTGMHGCGCGCGAGRWVFATPTALQEEFQSLQWANPELTALGAHLQTGLLPPFFKFSANTLQLYYAREPPENLVKMQILIQWVLGGV